MKRIVTVLSALVTSAALVLLLAHAAPGAADPAHAAAGATRYVCVACNLPCDKLVFDAPGNCPQCGMPLIEEAVAKKQAAERAAQQAAHPATKVAILVFNGVEIIDFTGPYEMFGTVGYDVYTVAASKDPVTTAMGMTVVPKYSFADAPKPDVLLVPGGGVKGASGDAPTLDWVRDASAHAGHTLSVCNGAFILASAGLLDGLKATTTARLIPQLHDRFPKVNVVNDQRFVDNGRIITAAGLSSGIDAALHLVSVLEGHGTAQDVALTQEYDWRPEAGFARAALADMNLPRIDMDAVGKFKLVHTEGDRAHWNIEARGTSDLAQADLAKKLDEDFAAGGKWVKASDGWSMQDASGQRWSGKLALAPDAATPHGYTVSVAITRESTASAEH